MNRAILTTKYQIFPVIFHNLSAYDAHLFIKNLGVTEGEIKRIPNNEEKHMSFTKTLVDTSFIRMIT